VAQNAATCVREIARCGERDATALVEAGVLVRAAQCLYSNFMPCCSV
jgi:hypothetical protein